MNSGVYYKFLQLLLGTSSLLLRQDTVHMEDGWNLGSQMPSVGTSAGGYVLFAA